MQFSQAVLLSALYSAVGLLVLVLAAGKDYYKILGVSKTASDRDIKRAFRKLAVQYHPDKNSEKGAEAKFRDIAEAYEVLGDAKKRQQYDQFGSDFEQRTGGGGGHPDFGFNFDDFFSKFDQSFKDHQRGHQRAHQRAHQQAHERASGFKFNLFDDLWDDDDDIGGFGNFEFPSFGDSLFDFGGGGFFSGGADVHMHQAHSSGGSGQRCSTVTQKIGNTVTTFTQCS